MDGNFVLGMDGFFWSFSYYEKQGNPMGDAEQITMHEIQVDAHTGKIIGKTSK